MTVEAPRLHNPWEKPWENAGHALHNMVDSFKFAVTRGFLRESLLNPRSYYRIWDRTPLSAEDLVRAPISTVLRPLVQHLTQTVANLVRRIP